MRLSLTVLMTVLVLGLAVPTRAGWWIFGKSKGEVELRYLQVNGVDVEEAEGAVAFTRDLLADGRLVVRGRARAGRATIGAVEVSLNDQATWEPAKMASDGTFEFSWEPRVGETYVVLVKAITTTGKTNPVEDTRVEVSLLDQDLRSLVVAALQRLVEAYEGENAAAFMANVSEHFAGDSMILDRAVRDDFAFFENVDINFTLNNLAVGRKGRIMVGISYTRSLLSARSGEQLHDRGMTEFTFVQEAGKAKVWAMKVPLIFGLSDPGEIATGAVIQAPNQEVIVVDETGNAATVPAQQAANQADGVSSEEGDFLLEHEQGWDFSGEEILDFTNFDDQDVGLDAWTQHFGKLRFSPHSVGGQDLGLGTINDFSEAPAGGYNLTDADLPAAVGHVYALVTREGHYALVEVVSFIAGRLRIRYKYQPDGSRFF